jgi:hypothetical protein
MAETKRPSDEGQGASSVVRSMREKGVVNLDVPLRHAVGYMAHAPGGQGELLAGALQRLHDQGVVNLDASMQKALDAIDMKELSRLEASLFANDNFCVVVKASK